MTAHGNTTIGYSAPHRSYMRAPITYHTVSKLSWTAGVSLARNRKDRAEKGSITYHFN